MELLVGPLGIIVAGVGGFVLYVGITNQLVQRRRLENSTSATGTVTTVDVEKETATQTPYYCPVLEYEYSHQGERRSSDQLYPGDISRGYNTRSRAEAVVEEFEEGNPISIYVDETGTDPAHAFVHRTTTAGRNAAVAGVGLAFCIAGTGMFVWAVQHLL
ncbi:DUF3592 domain-containing protein [Natrialbaceae archaeon A-arb3/5]